MVKLTRYDNRELYVNAELIQFIEAKPDTIITLTTGEKIIVKEKVEEVVSRIIVYKQTIYTRFHHLETKTPPQQESSQGEQEHNQEQ